MENEKTFKTKTGFCHILPDKIILTRDGIIGNVTIVMIGNNLTWIFIIYGGLSAFLLYSAFNSLKKGQVPILINYSIVSFLFMEYLQVWIIQQHQ